MRFNDIKTALSQLKKLSTAEDITDHFFMATIETGGTFFVPIAGDNMCGQMFEISLHGVFAHGEDPETLRRNWTRAANCELCALAEASPLDLIRWPIGEGAPCLV